MNDDDAGGIWRSWLRLAILKKADREVPLILRRFYVEKETAMCKKNAEKLINDCLGTPTKVGECVSAQPVTYEMNLNPEPFEAIRSGQKNVEMRLNDERRQPIRKGDFIRFTHTESGQTLLVRVLDKLVYADFTELYAHHDKTTIGYTADDVADPDDMLAYYTEEKIRKYGALAIVVELV